MRSKEFFKNCVSFFYLVAGKKVMKEMVALIWGKHIESQAHTCRQQTSEQQKRRELYVPWYTDRCVDTRGKAQVLGQRRQAGGGTDWSKQTPIRLQTKRLSSNNQKRLWHSVSVTCPKAASLLFSKLFSKFTWTHSFKFFSEIVAKIFQIQSVHK
jgi:hypothetical protein